MKSATCCRIGIKNPNQSIARKLGVFLALCVAASANAAVLQYQANLSGPNESPPNGSPGTGFAEVDYNNVTHTLLVEVVWSGLVAGTTASHIHAATTTPFTG